MRGILRGLGSRTLACGCVAGLYETYDARAVAILDVRATACTNPRHRSNSEIELAESAKSQNVRVSPTGSKER
jgi:hypothetical protein